MDLVECNHCGTVYHLKKDSSRPFRCANCKKTVALKTQKAKKKGDSEENERLRKFQDRLSRGIFLLGSTVGLFVLLMMIPTSMAFKDPGVVVVLLMLELVFGTLLVCSSVGFYLLNLQVHSLQSLMTFHQHNLHIFHDQISRLFKLLKRRD
jgi:hypothetical protein